MPELMPQFVSSNDVDLSKAEPGCKRCHGTGRKYWRATTPEQQAEGAPLRLPVVCDCVVRRGGLAGNTTAFMSALEKSMRNKDFVSAMAEDICKMPEDRRRAAVDAIRRSAARAGRSVDLKTAMLEVAARVEARCPTTVATE